MPVSAIAPMTGWYDYSEVARSVLIAIAASYAALDLTGRVAAATGRVPWAWLSGGSIAMGIGIWTMHLKGMLAFHLPVPVDYHWPTLLAGLSVAIFACAVALYVTSGQKMSRADTVTGSIVMGVGIAGLHYSLMGAMRMPAITRYSPLLVACSILLAVLFSLIALLMAFGLREETRWTVRRRAGSAIVMGIAISAMHYTGMAAATFFPASPPILSHTVSISPVGGSGVMIATLIVLVAAVITSSVDRHAHAEIQRLNQNLERRVAERTSQLTAVNRELAETEERFRKLVEALPDALYVHSENKIVFVNPFGIRLLGAQQPEQLVGKGILEIVHPDYRDFIRQRIQHCYQTGRASSPMECALVALDGSFVEVESAGIPITWKGSPAIEVVARDIRDRKRSEARLREYEEAVEGLEEMICVVDREYRYVLANRAFLNYRGVEREELVGRLVPEVLNPGLFEEVVKEKLDECLQGKVVTYELKYKYSDLGERHLSISYFPIESPSGIDRVACVLQDITERKQAEEALRTSEREQHKIAEQLEIERARLIEAQAVAKVGSWETELPSLDITWSEQTHRIFETDPSYFHPKRSGFVELIHPEDRAKVDAAFEASLESGAPSTVEYRIVMADGRVKVLEEHWKVFHDGQGIPARLIGTCQDITERKQAEESLRLFRMLLDQSNDAIEVVDPETLRFIDVNERACTDLGYSREELLSMRIHDISPNAESLNLSVSGELRNSGSAVFESLHQRKDGSTFPVEVSIKQVYLDRIYRVSVVRDITERKRAEMALRRSEENYRNFVAQSSEGIFRQDLDAPIPVDLPEDELVQHILRDSYLAECNDAIAKMYGLSSQQDFVGKRLTETLDPNDPRNVELTREYIRSGFRVLERESHEVDMQGNPKVFVNSMIGIVENGMLVRTWGIQRDVTEQRLAEQERQRLVAVVQNSPDFIGIATPEGKVLFVNRAGQEMLGIEGDAVVTSTQIWDYLSAEEGARFGREGLPLLLSGRPWHGELALKRFVTKQPVLVEVRAFPVLDDYGHVIGIANVSHDITQRKQAEQALQESQAELARVARIATLGELTASIAHEINQPLAAVATNASASLHWLAVQPPNLDEARQAMANAMNEANRASGVIKRLRTLLQKTPPQPQVVNVNEVIRDVLALAHRELITGGVATRTELATDLPPVLGDRVQLQQVMLNLIMNAIDAMSNVNDRPKRLLIKSAMDVEGVMIEVQDSGKGLDPEEASRIFDSFFTTKPEGIGMGLSISRSIVEAHGGRLRAETGPAQGAVFQVILPKAA